ncbi:MAG: hypothetical protein GXP37_11100 [Chloroflexi bacterium]|nr:hypothetical protein [Chloroflexota bacterium]
MTEPETMLELDDTPAAGPDMEVPAVEPSLPASPPTRTVIFALALLLSFTLGILGGFLMSVTILPRRFEAAVADILARQADEWAILPDNTTVQRPATSETAATAAAADRPVAESAAANQETATAQPASPAAVSAPHYQLAASYSNLGPRLLETGGIDFEKFTAIYQRAGQPLSTKQLAILQKGTDEPIVMNAKNAYFLLNFLWALGLVNKNPILTEGTMMQYGGEAQIARFASTGGWTIGSKQPAELYAASELISLTPEQQALLEEVAAAVYRPCCNNPTAFPDCNHGMAMLGLLELMASQGADANAMFEAAKWANAFWFPQQSQELARFFQASKNQDFDEINAQQAVSAATFSSSGFRSVHQWLADNNLLEQAPSSGNSCGV